MSRVIKQKTTAIIAERERERRNSSCDSHHLLIIVQCLHLIGIWILRSILIMTIVIRSHRWYWKHHIVVNLQWQQIRAHFQHIHITLDQNRWEGEKQESKNYFLFLLVLLQILKRERFFRCNLLANLFSLSRAHSFLCFACLPFLSWNEKTLFSLSLSL